MASTIRKTYSDTFKLSVARYALDIKNFSATARKFDLSVNTVRRWVETYKPQIENEIPSTSSLKFSKHSSNDHKFVADFEILRCKIRLS